MAEMKEDQKTVYFNMNMPAWFMEKPVEEKCSIVEKLAKDLESERPITEKQQQELRPRD